MILRLWRPGGCEPLYLEVRDQPCAPGMPTHLNHLVSSFSPHSTPMSPLEHNVPITPHCPYLSNQSPGSHGQHGDNSGKGLWEKRGMGPWGAPWAGQHPQSPQHPAARLGGTQGFFILCMDATASGYHGVKHCKHHSQLA